MRIKIIGENNCARATRHLLRLAGFAVTEFLPVDAVIHAPHSGYAITIELAPAQPLTSPVEIPGGAPSEELEQATHGQPAAVRGEASLLANGASSRLFSRGASAEASATGGGANQHFGAGGGGYIHFDSCDGRLEAEVLRHVSRLAKVPVMVDRPGGIVHSERELRIVVPVMASGAGGEVRMDEAAAVAVEFGVMRGLLDLTSGGRGAGGLDSVGQASGCGDLKCGDGEATEAAFAEGENPQAVACAAGGGLRGKWWWPFGIALMAAGLILFVRGAIAARVPGAARPGAPYPEPQGQVATGAGVKIFDGTNTLILDPCKAQIKSFVSVNQTGNAQLVAGTASKKIYICSIHVVVASATNVALVEGTGTVCGTGTAGVSGFGGATAATGWNFGANGGIVLGNGESSVGAEGTSADNLCLFNSGSGQVSGGISYVAQ